MTSRPWKDIIEESKKASSSFEPIPEDDYDFVISKVETVKTQTGKDMHKVQAKIISGDYARRVVFHNFVLSLDNPTSMNIFFRQMTVLGLDEAYFASDPTVEKMGQDLVGRVFRGTVKIVSDPKYRNGEPQNEIKNFATPSAEARQAALSVPTSVNPNPAASPTAGAPAAVPAPAAAPPAPAAPSVPAAPAQESVPTPAPETVAAPPVAAPPAPASVPLPPPPPPVQF